MATWHLGPIPRGKNTVCLTGPSVQLLALLLAHTLHEIKTDSLSLRCVIHYCYIIVARLQPVSTPLAVAINSTTIGFLQHSGGTIQGTITHHRMPPNTVVCRPVRQDIGAVRDKSKSRGIYLTCMYLMGYVLHACASYSRVSGRRESCHTTKSVTGLARLA